MGLSDALTRRKTNLGLHQCSSFFFKLNFLSFLKYPTHARTRTHTYTLPLARVSSIQSNLNSSLSFNKTAKWISLSSQLRLYFHYIHRVFLIYHLNLQVRSLSGTTFLGKSITDKKPSQFLNFPFLEVFEANGCSFLFKHFSFLDSILPSILNQIILNFGYYLFLFQGFHSTLELFPCVDILYIFFLFT